MVGVEEDFRVQCAEHGIAAEKPREHQDLGGQKEPDAELARVVLLLERLEVVRQVLGMLVRRFGEYGLRHESTQYSVLSGQYSVLKSKI